jgi:hypothetical protein
MDKLAKHQFFYSRQVCMSSFVMEYNILNTTTLLANQFHFIRWQYVLEYSKIIGNLLGNPDSRSAFTIHDRKTILLRYPYLCYLLPCSLVTSFNCYISKGCLFILISCEIRILTASCQRRTRYVQSLAISRKSSSNCRLVDILWLAQLHFAVHTVRTK